MPCIRCSLCQSAGYHKRYLVVYRVLHQLYDCLILLGSQSVQTPPQILCIYHTKTLMSPWSPTWFSSGASSSSSDRILPVGNCLSADCPWDLQLHTRMMAEDQHCNTVTVSLTCPLCSEVVRFFKTG